MLNLHQTITSPTRCTNKTKSLPDVFLLTNKSSSIKSGILTDKPLTDHEDIYLFLNTKIHHMLPIINTVRQDKNLNPFVFVKDLSNLPFHEIYESCHPNTMLSKFTTLFLSILDKHAPFKQITISKPPAPWIDNSIKKMIFKRDKVYRKAKKTQSPADLFQYSLLHKKVKHCIFQAKQNFIDKCLSKPNLKKVWNVINRLLKPSCKPILHDIDKLNDFLSIPLNALLAVNPYLLKSQTLLMVLSNFTVSLVTKFLTLLASLKLSVLLVLISFLLNISSFLPISLLLTSLTLLTPVSN